MRYQWIQQHRQTFPVAAMCRVLEVSDSGYYDWLQREPSVLSRRFLPLVLDGVEATK